MKHILFVDDEPMVLSGLRRMLRPMRHEWEMAFVGGGKEALEKMAETHFDVIVSDMRMPGMSGVELLDEVRKRHPHVTRLILSGHSDMEMILKSVETTHQFLAKPCDAETLKDTVERTCMLQGLLQDENLSKVISRISTLPSLPSLYIEITQEVESPDASIAKVGEIIDRDVGMTAKILQLVNSAFFGLRHHVSTPSQAASLLGLDVIRSLVLATEVFSSFKGAASGIDIGAMWAHCYHVSTLAKKIAQEEGADAKSCDHALMAGMLHDVGRLILANYLPDEYAAVTPCMEEKSIPVWEAERTIFNCTHMEVGGYLLGLWGLPNPIVEAVVYHHNPSKGSSDGFTPLTAVHTANALIRGEAEPLDREYLDQIGQLERLSKWETLYEQLRQKWEPEE